jgi:SRSO17 transposase
MDRVVVDVVAAELDRVHVRIAGRFTRSEPRERVREYVSWLVAGLERKNGLIVDDTGFLKKGTRTAGLERQYSGTAGRTENCQIGTFLVYTSARGHALVDRELYLPESWTDDRRRCRAAGIPEEVAFATKPRQAMAMLARAFAARVPFAWVTADEVYGQVRYLRVAGRTRRVLRAGDPPHRGADHHHRPPAPDRSNGRRPGRAGLAADLGRCR